MEFIYDDVMEEYQSTGRRMDFIIAADIYDEQICLLAENIEKIYTERLQEIGETVANLEWIKNEHPQMSVSEIILRLGKPVIMLEGFSDGEIAGLLSYFENKIDENEVIEIEFTGELNCLFAE